MGTTLFPFVATPWSAQRSPKRTLDSSGDSKRAPCEPRRPQESQGDFRRAQESPRSRQESTEGRREIRVSSGGLHPTPAYSRGHLGKPYPRKPRRAYRNTSRVLGGPRSAQGVEQAMDDVRKARLRSTSKVWFTQPGFHACIPNAVKQNRAQEKIKKIVGTTSLLSPQG